MTDAEKIDLLSQMVDFLFLQLVDRSWGGNSDALYDSLGPEGKRLLDAYVDSRHG